MDPGIRNAKDNGSGCKLLVWCFCWLGLLIGALGANWPAFRGPHANGVAEKEKPPIWFNQSSNLLWKIDLLPGHSSPVVWEDRLFVTGEEANKLTTICINPSSGRTLW